MSKADAKVLPSPKAHEVYGNVDMRQVRQVDGRTLKSKKGLEQFNTWVRPGLRKEMADVQRQVEAELGRDFSRGEFLEMLFMAFQKSRDPEAVKAVLSKGQPSDPPPADKAAGRTVPMVFFASKEQSAWLNATSAKSGWTMGVIVEDLMARALNGDEAMAKLAALQNGQGKEKR